MVLGIVLHTALCYFVTGWDFVDHTAIEPDLALITTGIHLFRMPAFFLLSGFFAALLWQRHGARSMLKNRFQRIVLPFAVFVMLLWPMLVFSHHFADSVLSGGTEPYRRAASSVWEASVWPDSTMHLWFLYDLIFITAAASGLAALLSAKSRLLDFIKRTFECPLRFVLVIGGFNLLWCIAMGWDSLPTEGAWLPEQIEIIVYYLLWFGLGWLVFASQAVIDTAKKGAWTLVGVGLACTWILKSVEKSLERPSIEAESPVTDAPGPIQGGVDQSVDLINAMLPDDFDFWSYGAMFCFSVGCVAFTRGLMGLFIRYAGSGSYFWRYISDSSYWVYLLHLPLTVVVPTLLYGWQVPVFIKFPTAVLLISGICWITYDGLVRPTLVGRFLNGRRYPSFAPRLSPLGSILVVGALTYGVIDYPPPDERPPPWNNGKRPSELLPDETVTYPMQPTRAGLEEVSFLSRCVGVGRYILCPDPALWEEIELACASFGAHPAAFETEAENKAIGELTSKLTMLPFWVLVTDRETEGEWQWPNGETLDYEPWHEREPNDWGGQEDCAALNWAGHPRWNDIPCDDRFGFICETGAPPSAIQPEEATDEPALDTGSDSPDH